MSYNDSVTTETFDSSEPARAPRPEPRKPARPPATLPVESLSMMMAGSIR